MNIVSATGKPIKVGDVLRSIEDNTTGVVARIVKAGEIGSFFDQVGDLHIKISPGSYKISNRYSFWKHVPRAEQTFEQRFLSWLYDKNVYDYNDLLSDNSQTDDSRKAISGIMALLPEDTVNWEDGPWPGSIEQALRFLVEFFEKNIKK